MNVKDVNVFSLLTQIFQVSSTLTRGFSSGTTTCESVVYWVFRQRVGVCVCLKVDFFFTFRKFEE